MVPQTGQINENTALFGTGSRVILLLVPEDTGSRATLLFFSTEDVDSGITCVCFELFTGGAGGSGSNSGSRSIPISCEHLGQVVSDPSHSSSASNFVLQKGLHTELVEIKSGNDFKKHLAMDHAMKVEQWKFEKNIVFSKSNVEEDGEILYLPWYMILFYKQEREPEKMIYEIDLSGLV